jgi:hypothetical protein
MSAVRLAARGATPIGANDNHNWFNTIGPDLVGTGFNIDTSGILGGGQAGFNYQTGSWVIGIEGSVAGANLDSSRRSAFFPASDTYTAGVDLLTTVTGRVGYARDKWLAYAKGGWADADVELTLFDHGTPVVPTRATGPTAGRSAAAANTPFARTSRLASSTTMPSSIKMAGGSVARLVPQAWAAEYRSSTATSRFNR